MDAGKRLERHGSVGAFGQSAAEIVPVAAHGEGSRADRTAEVEGEHLRSVVASELQSHQREQDGLARAGRSDDERVTDIADMEGKPERSASLGPAVKQRGCAEVLVAFRPRPHCGERDHMGEIERRDRRLADVGVSVPR